MPPLPREQKHQALVQLRNNVSTCKVAALVGMSQSSIAHLKKDVGGEIERQRGGRPKLLADREKRRCATLVTESRPGIASATTKQLQSETSKFLSNNTMRHALREAGLGAQVQQRKSFFSHKHVLARLRFAQRYEIWTIDDWKRVIFNDETKINRISSNGRSWCSIGDGERIWTST